MKAVKRVRPGGTCNSDALALTFKRMPHPSTRAKYDEALKVAGLHGFWSNAWYRTPMCIISPNVPGQGFPQTKAAETMAEYLKGLGYDASVRYMMD